MTREQWLNEAVVAIAGLFGEHDISVPEVRVSVGWPGGRGKKSTTIGQCWRSECSGDKISQIFISPVLEDSREVLETLVHELVHAIDNNDSGHKGFFVKTARLMGLEGKPTATHAGKELRTDLIMIAADLGKYPHSALTPTLAAAKTQTTRMIKATCPSGSGYMVRMTRMWIEEYGAPKCACHDETMEVQE